MKIYDDLALEAWTQREREREKETREKGARDYWLFRKHTHDDYVCHRVCYTFRVKVCERTGKDATLFFSSVL